MLFGLVAASLLVIGCLILYVHNNSQTTPMSLPLPVSLPEVKTGDRDLTGFQYESRRWKPISQVHQVISFGYPVWQVTLTLPRTLHRLRKSLHRSVSSRGMYGSVIWPWTLVIKWLSIRFCIVHHPWSVAKKLPPTFCVWSWNTQAFKKITVFPTMDNSKPWGVMVYSFFGSVIFLSAPSNFRNYQRKWVENYWY